MAEDKIIIEISDLISGNIERKIKQIDDVAIKLEADINKAQNAVDSFNKRMEAGQSALSRLKDAYSNLGEKMKEHAELTKLEKNYLELGITLRKESARVLHEELVAIGERIRKEEELKQKQLERMQMLRKGLASEQETQRIKRLQALDEEKKKYQEHIELIEAKRQKEEQLIRTQNERRQMLQKGLASEQETQGIKRLRALDEEKKKYEEHTRLIEEKKQKEAQLIQTQNERRQMILRGLASEQETQEIKRLQALDEEKKKYQEHIKLIEAKRQRQLEVNEAVRIAKEYNDKLIQQERPFRIQSSASKLRALGSLKDPRTVASTPAIDDIQRLDIARKVFEQGRAFENAQKSGSKFRDVLTSITTAYRLFIGSIIANKIIGIADEYTNVSNRLRLVTKDTADHNELQNKLFNLARESRIEVGALANSFVRYNIALSELGASQSEVLEFTSTLTKNIQLSGLATSEQNAVLLQFSQALNKGKLDGDEFRTVMENLPVVAKAIAKQLGVTRGELLKLAPQGVITSEVMRKAMASIARETKDNFKETNATIGSAFTNLLTSITEVSGKFLEATGIAKGFTSSINFLADSFKYLAFTIGLLVLTGAVAFFQTLTKAIQESTKAMAILNIVTGTFSKTLDIIKAFVLSLGGVAAILGVIVGFGIIYYADIINANTALKEQESIEERRVFLAKEHAKELALANVNRGKALELLSKEVKENEKLKKLLTDAKKNTINSSEANLLAFELGNKEIDENLKSNITLVDFFAKKYPLLVDTFNEIQNSLTLESVLDSQALIIDNFDSIVRKEIDAYRKKIDIVNQYKLVLGTVKFLEKVNVIDSDTGQKILGNTDLGKIINDTKELKKSFFAKPEEEGIFKSIAELNKKYKDGIGILYEYKKELEGVGFDVQADINKLRSNRQGELNQIYLNEIARLKKEGKDDPVKSFEDKFRGNAITDQFQRQQELIEAEKKQAIELAQFKYDLAQKTGQDINKAQTILDNEKKAITEKSNQQQLLNTQELVAGTISLYAGTADALSGMFKSIEGDRSKSAKVAFAISKGLAVAEATLNLYSAISKANAIEGNPALKAAAIANAITIGVGAIANIASTVFAEKHSASAEKKSAKYAKGGYVYGSGTGTSDSINANLSNGEYVVNAQSTRANRAFLEYINSGGKIGGNGNKPANINIINNAGAKVSAVDNGDNSFDIYVEKIEQRIASNFNNGRGSLHPVITNKINRSF